MSEVTGRLENWKQPSDGWGALVIWGEIHDDVKERFVNGKLIHTSRVEDKKFKEGDIVKTDNSVYLLGKELK